MPSHGITEYLRLDNKTAGWAWQTSAWSGGQREPRAHLYQRTGAVTVGGVECDVNEALQADFGQYPITTISPGHLKERHEMDQLPATDAPADPNSEGLLRWWMTTSGRLS